MKRRQFGAMLAAATFSLAGVPGRSGAVGDASAQETEPLFVEDVTVNVGSVTSSFGSVVLEFDEAASTITFEINDWTMDGPARTLSIGTARVAIEEEDATTFAQIRAAMAEAFETRSFSPLFASLAEADVSAGSPIRVFVGPVALNGETLFEQMTATGTVGAAVPEGARELVLGGASLAAVVGLGPSEWGRVTVQKGGTRLALNNVTMEFDGATVAVTAPGGSIETASRSLDVSEVDMNIFPPDPIPAAHVEFASQLRQLAAQGSLSLSAIRDAAAASGVTVANTVEAVGAAPFDMTLGTVTEGGETLLSNFETGGTLAELVQVLRSRL